MSEEPSPTFFGSIPGQMCRLWSKPILDQPPRQFTMKRISRTCSSPISAMATCFEARLTASASVRTRSQMDGMPPEVTALRSSLPMATSLFFSWFFRRTAGLYFSWYFRRCFARRLK